MFYVIWLFYCWTHIHLILLIKLIYYYLLYLIILMILIYYLFFNKGIFIYWYYFLFIFYLQNQIINPLIFANTLFLIHPYYFITSIICIKWYYYTYKYYYININYGCLCALTVFLGGYWSLQEYNWGGWWNWDSLEILLLILYCYNIILFHKRNNIFITLNTLFFIYLIISIVYIWCNKSGFNISIHKFITNVFLLYFIFYYYIKILLITLHPKGIQIQIFLFFYFFIFIYVHIFSFCKLCVIYLIYYYLIQLKTTLIYFWHKILYFNIIIFLYFNILNWSFTHGVFIQNWTYYTNIFPTAQMFTIKTQIFSYINLYLHLYFYKHINFLLQNNWYFTINSLFKSNQIFVNFFK